MNRTSQQIQRLLEGQGWLIRFFTDSSYARHRDAPDAADFVAGNPQELALPDVVQAFQRWSAPRDKDWFAYKLNEPEATRVVAASLRERLGLPFRSEDVFMTTGAFGGLAVALRAIVDPGDEVIFVSPPWFFYEPLIAVTGGVPVRVRSRPPSFDLDLEAIAAAITPRTTGIIVNTPNNPSGRVYPRTTLEPLARLLADASRRNARPIYLLSDESYRRIVFDGRAFVSPSAFYPDTLVIYTYGKTLLMPGQRLGYIALPPTMPEREALSAAIVMSQVLTAYAVPNALLQHALVDLEPLSIDIVHLQQKRDRVVQALREAGYELHVPEGTFYLLPRSPLSDDASFTELLAEHRVFVLPGRMVELPGYFRISLTANDDMIDRALPVFASVIKQTVTA